MVFVVSSLAFRLGSHSIILFVYLSTDFFLKSGVSDSYVRLSVGIEHIDDIVDDLAEALEKSQEK